MSLLIADPIVSAVSGDSHKNTEVRRALQPLVPLADKLGFAVLGMSHFRKGSAGRDPVERVTGSIAFAALARIVLVTVRTRASARKWISVTVMSRSGRSVEPSCEGWNPVYA